MKEIIFYMEYDQCMARIDGTDYQCKMPKLEAEEIDHLLYGGHKDIDACSYDVGMGSIIIFMENRENFEHYYNTIIEVEK